MNLKQQAENVAKAGRYGDSMLLHVNPVEMQSLRKQLPITKNPKTGQDEAFLPFLAPLLGQLAGGALLTGVGGLSSLAAGAIGGGLAQWAATGDFKKGLLAGVSSYGVGRALQGASAAAEGAKAADAATQSALQDTAVKLGIDTPGVTTGLTASGDFAVNALNPNVAAEMGSKAVQGTIDAARTGATQAGMNVATTQTPLQNLQNAFTNPQGNLDLMAGTANVAGTLANDPLAYIPTAVGMGGTSIMESQEAYEDYLNDLARQRTENEKKNQEDYEKQMKALMPMIGNRTAGFQEGGVPAFEDFYFNDPYGDLYGGYDPIGGIPGGYGGIINEPIGYPIGIPGSGISNPVSNSQGPGFPGNPLSPSPFYEAGFTPEFLSLPGLLAPGFENPNIGPFNPIADPSYQQFYRSPFDAGFPVAINPYASFNPADIYNFLPQQPAFPPFVPPGNNPPPQPPIQVPPPDPDPEPPATQPGGPGPIEPPGKEPPVVGPITDPVVPPGGGGFFKNPVTGPISPIPTPPSGGGGGFDDPRQFNLPAPGTPVPEPINTTGPVIPNLDPANYVSDPSEDIGAGQGDINIPSYTLPAIGGPGGITIPQGYDDYINNLIQAQISQIQQPDLSGFVTQDALAGLLPQDTTRSDAEINELISQRLNALPQPQQFDPTALQNQVSALSQQVSSFQPYDPSGLQEQFGSLQNQLGQLQGQFDGFQQFDPSGLQSQIAANQAAIQGLNIPGAFDPSGLQGQIDVLSDQIAGLPDFSRFARRSDIVPFDPSALQGQLSGLQGQVSGLQNQFAGFQPFDPSELQGQIGQLQGQLGSLPDFSQFAMLSDLPQGFDPSGLQDQLSGLQNQVAGIQPFDPSSLQNQIGNLQNQYGQLQGQLAGLPDFGQYALRSDIPQAFDPSGLQAQILANQQAISGFQPFNPAELQNQIGQLQGQFAALPDFSQFARTSDIVPEFDPTNLQGQIGQLQGQLGSLPDFSQFAQMSDLPAAFDPSGLQSQISGLQQQISNIPQFDPSGLQGQISGLQSQFGGLPDFSQFAMRSDIPQMPNLSGIQSDIAALQGQFGALPDFSQFAMQSEIPTMPDMSQYALQSQLFNPSSLQNQLAGLQGQFNALPDFSQFALASQIPQMPNMSNFVTQQGLASALNPYALQSQIPMMPDLSGFAPMSAIPDVSNFVTNQQLANAFMANNRNAMRYGMQEGKDAAVRVGAMDAEPIQGFVNLPNPPDKRLDFGITDGYSNRLIQNGLISEANLLRKYDIQKDPEKLKQRVDEYIKRVAKNTKNSPGKLNTKMMEDYLYELVGAAPREGKANGKKGEVVETANKIPNMDAALGDPNIVFVIEHLRGLKNHQDIVDAFIEKHGSQAYLMVRDMVLKEGNSNRQTEGMVQGESRGGMTDDVAMNIGQSPEAAISQGEYIIAADVVSDLGDGDSASGARVLDKFMENVRQEKNGSPKQPAPLKKSIEEYMA